MVACKHICLFSRCTYTIKSGFQGTDTGHRVSRSLYSVSNVIVMLVGKVLHEIVYVDARPNIDTIY